MYTVPMARVKIEAWKCDVCGWTWIPESTKEPERCPSRKCRSIRWNSGKVEKMIIARDTEPEKPKAIPKATETEKPVKVGRLAPCPRCEGPPVSWGPMRRCQKCGQNWPLD